MQATLTLVGDVRDLARVLVQLAENERIENTADALLSTIKPVPEKFYEGLNEDVKESPAKEKPFDYKVKFKKSPAVVEEKPKRKRRTKAEMEAARNGGDLTQSEKKQLTPVMDGEEDSDDNHDVGDDYIETDATEMVEDFAAPAEVPKKELSLTLEGDVIPAFRTYAGKFSREAAGKVLARLGVKSVKDLPPAKYSQALKELRS